MQTNLFAAIGMNQAQLDIEPDMWSSWMCSSHMVRIARRHATASIES